MCWLWHTHTNTHTLEFKYPPHRHCTDTFFSTGFSASFIRHTYEQSNDVERGQSRVQAGMRSSSGLEQGWGHDPSRLVRAPGLARPHALTGGRQAVLFLFTIIKATIADSVCAPTAKLILCLTEGACFWTGVLFQTACQTSGWYGYIAMFVWLVKIRLRLLPWVNINKTPHDFCTH